MPRVLQMYIFGKSWSHYQSPWNKFPIKVNNHKFELSLILKLNCFLVVIFLRATGNAPILKQNKFKISSAQQFISIQEFVRKQLLLQERDPLVH